MNMMNEDLTDVKTELRYIGPTEAEELLKLNQSNRKIVHRRVERYARKMVTGRWPFTGDPIQISTVPSLINGQHRLWAIITSGVTIPINVITGLAPETQRYMDQGRNRTAANQLAIEGTPNPVAAGAISRAVIAWGDGAIVARRNDSVTIDDIAEFNEKNGERVQDAVILAERVRSTVAVPSIGAVGAVAYRCLEIDEDATHEFFDAFATGANLPDGHPILTLRNHLMKLRRQRVKRTVGEIAYLVVVTWNAWYAGRDDMTRIQLPKNGVTDKNFPPLLDKKGRVDDADDEHTDQLATTPG